MAPEARALTTGLCLFGSTWVAIFLASDHSVFEAWLGTFVVTAVAGGVEWGLAGAAQRPRAIATYLSYLLGTGTALFHVSGNNVFVAIFGTFVWAAAANMMTAFVMLCVAGLIRVFRFSRAAHTSTAAKVADEPPRKDWRPLMRCDWCGHLDDSHLPGGVCVADRSGGWLCHCQEFYQSEWRDD